MAVFACKMASPAREATPHHRALLIFKKDVPLLISSSLPCAGNTIVLQELMWHRQREGFFTECTAPWAPAQVMFATQLGSGNPAAQMRGSISERLSAPHMRYQKGFCLRKCIC